MDVSSEKDLKPCGVEKWICEALEISVESSGVGGSEEVVRIGLEFEVMASWRLSNGSFCAVSAKAMVSDLEIGVQKCIWSCEDMKASKSSKSGCRGGRLQTREGWCTLAYPLGQPSSVCTH